MSRGREPHFHWLFRGVGPGPSSRSGTSKARVSFREERRTYKGMELGGGGGGGGRN